ncbi:hypothetical protein MY9_0247 [Bacillus sp. JS]|nr:hypothetical protein MY9_0247 [Bacillus sp. JS]
MLRRIPAGQRFTVFYKISENKDIDLLFICLTIKQKDIWEGADVKERFIKRFQLGAVYTNNRRLC